MTASWPTGRSPRAELVARFGEARADLVGRALRTGDPLADAVVDEIRARGRAVREQFDRGIRHGLASLQDPPPAVAALLSSAESLPAGITPAVVEAGARPVFTSPPPVHTLSLSAGALLRTYGSPSIAVLLDTTGRLVDGAERRLTETGRWLLSATLPGALRPGEPGYVMTLQVRILHAHMRELARTRGYDERAHGTPINQIDLARTWLDFTLVSLRAEETIGFGLTDAEIAEVYTYWQLLGHLLGIDAELTAGVTGHRAAARLDDLVTAVTGPLAPQARVLAGATVDAIAALLVGSLRLPRPVGRLLLEVLARRFHGPQVADALGLRRSRLLEVAVGAGSRVVRFRRERLRRRPAALEDSRRRNVAATRALLADDQIGPALFQSYRGEPGPRHAPERPSR
ncbi:oxygenase MpaB family protein [Pseudonocardia sp. NPDC049635]|uniref:oxygenase MpaB family protein n=1 Tax=Pseudonocardia sp. NPDC049635 TaxID=3155506 RepID=UPI0033FC4D57